jgi:hypothetical protein
MKLASARALKQELLAEGYPERALTTVRATALRMGAVAATPRRSSAHVALGVTGQESDVKVAARIQYATQPEAEAIARDLRRRTRGEIELRRLPPIKKQAAPWHQSRNRPLSIGGSISLFTPNSRFVTAGTLGCFVRRRGNRDEDLILSNNHVLADENQASRGHLVIQPGSLDGGGRGDAVGKLEKFIRLKARANLVDAAVASIDEGIEYYYNWLEGEGALRGRRTTALRPGTRVFKVGRTTGRRDGEISAVELDGVLIEYDTGDFEFDDQIEITRVGRRPFSLGGDSGSLIVDRERRAVGLLFAGDDVDVTYANPIQTVLDELDLELVF